VGAEVAQPDPETLALSPLEHELAEPEQPVAEQPALEDEAVQPVEQTDLEQVQAVESQMSDEVYGDDGEGDLSYEELTAVEAAQPSQGPASDADLWTVLENGIRDISGEVRNSLDFHRSQEGGGEVSHVVLSGSVRDIPGFAEALQSSLGVEVRCQELALADGDLGAGVSVHRLAVATGLAAVEAPQ
jgi:Tfp pilus assembly PilM family ATPase